MNSFLKYKNKFRESKKLATKEFENNLVKLLLEENSLRVCYKNLVSSDSKRKAYDFVNKKFPAVGVLEIDVFMAPYKVLNKCGFKGMAGFYSPGHKVIIISEDIPKENYKQKDLLMTFTGDVSVDETIVHELLHYCRHETCKDNWNIDLEEEFAYGHSIPYMLQRHTDEEVVLDYMSPYLLSKVDIGKIFRDYAKEKELTKTFESDNESFIARHQRALYARVKKEILKLGLAIVEKYKDSDSIVFCPVVKEVNRYDILDI